MLLGIGGVWVLCLWLWFIGVLVFDVYYVNEGYVGFFGFEWICEFVVMEFMMFDEVFEVVWVVIVFIMYILVFVGIDRFGID